MPAYYKGSNYKPYQSPRSFVKRVSDRIYWRAIAIIALFVIVALGVTYKHYIG